jgi:hypothetical protein
VITVSILLMGGLFILSNTGCPNSPSSPAPTPVPTVCQTVGYANAGSNATKANTFLEAFAVTVSTPMTVSSLSVSIGSVGSGHTVLGLYTNVSGYPVSLLTSGVVTETVSSINNVNVSPVAIGAGNYWLAFDNNTASTDFNGESGSVTTFQATYTYNGTLPNPMASGLTLLHAPYSIYLYGCH